MSRVHRLEAARKLAAHALSKGGQRSSLSQVNWDISGRCQSPLTHEAEGRADTRKGETGMPVSVVMEVRCRKCPACLRTRAYEWRTRATAEIGASWRTWFGTLTLRPEEHYLAELRASAALLRRGVSLAELSPQEQFAERHRAISDDITKWLKRVRKISGSKLRYCLVVEAHKSGLPHYHILVHEVSQDLPVTKRQLQSQWLYGFTQFKLVEDSKAAAYVTKYLHKSAQARVRASLHYGKYALSIAEQFLREKIPPKKETDRSLY